MAGLTCPGCKKLLDNNSAFGRHRSSCLALHLLTKKKLRNSKIKSKTKKEEKLARLKVPPSPSFQLLKADFQRRLSSMRRTASQQSVAIPTSPGNTEPIVAPPRPPKVRTIFPRAYQDELPPAPPYIPQANELDDDFQLDSDIRDTPGLDPQLEDFFQTAPDSFGVYRKYATGKPSITPDLFHSLSEVSNSPYLALDPSLSSQPPSSSFISSAFQKIKQNLVDTAENFFAPFQNVSVFRLMTWFYRSSNTKSIGELNSLVNDVLLAPGFNTEDLIGFDAAKENRRVDNYHEAESSATQLASPFSFDDGWIKSTIEIPVPCNGFCYNSEAEAPKFKVEIHHRKITEVIKSAYAEPGAAKFTTFPFKAYWKPTENVPAERIYSEIFTADAWNNEFEKIMHTTPDEANSHLERFIIGLMIWSDSTSLAQFGTAELWPCYLFIGGQTKYDRVKPSSFAAHHLAYLPKLDDIIQEFYMTTFGKPATSEMLTHLRRELAQAVWLLILDEDFIEAYIHGLQLTLADDIDRLGLIRMLTYSADYVEKVLMACIKYLSKCACPRCLVLKSKFPMLGSKRDMQDRIKLKRIDDEATREAVEFARRLIFEKGVGVGSKRIANILGPKSLVPTRNAFSERLHQVGLNYYELFIVDLLHEFELGVWMATFKHLLRLLYALGGHGIQKLNERYRQIPTFGRGTIRRFGRNASDLKKMAARDYEDLLQCAIPVFEGLFPPKEDAVVRKLLFELATWHALAKLRLHTETTVTDLENSTTRLGENMRKFQKDVCDKYATYDLPSEEAARGRRKAATEAKKSTTASQKKEKVTKGKSTNRKRQFLLNTIKFHSLGGYAKAIRLYGTTDNYSSQTGELEHRRVKRMYRRVHKGRHVHGIGLQVRRERYLHLLQERKKRREQLVKESVPATVPFEEDEQLPSTQPEQRYHIASDSRHKINVARWLAENKSDPALLDFLPRLKNHLLSRLLGYKYDGDELDFTSADRRLVVIENNVIFRHKVLRVNYTTYDLRRDQDSLNPRVAGHADFIVLSPENEEDNMDPHPYWYGRILGIFHANVRHMGPQAKSPEPQRMDFLFVRWFGRDMTPKAGWKTKRLIRLGFVPGNDEGAFGFVDPAQVIRAVHLIPAFAWDRTTKYLPPSPIARSQKNPDDDWQLYYVGMFVDRDMMMRFRGGGVGHKSTREATDFFKKDRDKLDIQLRSSMHNDEVMDIDGAKDKEPEEIIDSEDEEIVDEDEEIVDEDEEEDFGILKDQEVYSDDTDDEEGLEEPEEEEFGPEGDGTGVDQDMEELGYDEL